jgi:hypothetical protein
MMRRALQSTLGIGITLLLFAACAMPQPGGTVPGGTVPETAPPTAEPAEEAAAPSGASAAEVCPTPTEDTQVMINVAGGYCFLAPAGYVATEFPPNELIVYAPVETEGHRERALINAEPADGRTPADLADAQEADVAANVPGMPITRTATTLGGEEAIVLEVLPGQDLNRVVYTAHGDTVYRLMFVPLDPAMGEAFAQMEELYSLLMSSFTFLDATGATAPTGDAASLLSWEGVSADGACLSLTILPDGEAQVGLCGDAPKTVEISTGPESEWAAVQSHFASMDAETPRGRIRFQGQGTASGAAWERALSAWAWFTAQELHAGRTSAAGRTALAWRLGESADQAGQCEMLLVMAYGYAYANLVPCEGNGQSQPLAQGWLETAEWETFEGWLTNRARVEGEAGYLDAQGSEPLAAEELDAWAAAVFERLVGR